MNPSEILVSLVEDFGPTEYVYIGLAVTILTLILLLISRRQPKKIAAYQTDNGRVFVARTAIKELVQTSCQQINGVTKPSCTIAPKGGKLNLEVQIKLESGSQMRVIEAQLQQHMRKALTENLGIEKLGHINVVAVGFKSARISSSSANKTQDEETQVLLDQPE